MKKLLLFFALIMSIFFSAQAGYVIKGITASATANNLKNYTLALNANGYPVSAASIYTPSGGGTGRNTIVIITAGQYDPIFRFPISFPSGADEIYDIDVLDFHYVPSRDVYVLCGSRKTNTYSRAFVAVIQGNLSSMQYNEYSEADMFYSIWAENAISPSLDYYVCGKSGAHGVIASIRTSNLVMTNCYGTENEWEYHKIIAKQIIPGGSYRFVASGRNPACTQIGYTLFLPSFSPINSYAWAQNSEPNSHCVLCDNVLASSSDQIILASSYQSSVTLHFVSSFASPFMLVNVYNYVFPSTPGSTKYNVQDIGMFPINDAVYPHISVVGYIEDVSNFRTMAWYGYVLVAVSPSVAMLTNSYYGSAGEEYMHYKIKGDQQGDVFTGGYQQNSVQKMGALFGKPITVAPNCDHRSTNMTTILDDPIPTTFNLLPKIVSVRDYNTFSGSLYSMDYYFPCTPFKVVEPAPELAMPAEQESEITTYNDHITVKDISTHTHYQIYSATGQLLQTGVTTSDISTTQLSKGLYILRLENGKAFKFVK